MDWLKLITPYLPAAALFLVESGLQVSGITNLGLAVGLWGAAALAFAIALWHTINEGRKEQGKPRIRLEPSHVIVAGLVIAASGVIWQYAQRPATITHAPDEPPSQKTQDDGPLKWDDHIGQTYAGGPGAIVTHAFQIGAVNRSQKTVQIEDAFVISENPTTKIQLMVNVAGQWVPANSINIPPGGSIVFRAEINPPDGLPARDFFEQWKAAYLVVKYDGMVCRRIIDEKMVAALFGSFRPNPLLPPVAHSGSP